VGTRSRLCYVGWVVWVHNMRDLVPTSPLTSPVYTDNTSIAAY